MQMVEGFSVSSLQGNSQQTGGGGQQGAQKPSVTNTLKQTPPKAREINDQIVPETRSESLGWN